MVLFLRSPDQIGHILFKHMIKWWVSTISYSDSFIKYNVMKTKENKKSRMLKELEQAKILGGRTNQAARLSMKNCKVICADTGDLDQTVEQKLQ